MVYPHSYRTEHSETVTTSSAYGSYFAVSAKHKIKIQPPLLKILQTVDSNRKKYLNNLREIISIKSISGELKYHDEIKKAIKCTEAWLTKLNIKFECFNTGFYKLDGQKVKRPSIILASLGKDLNKKTLCIYAHLDVKHPDIKNWNTNPWEIQQVGKRFYGCGIAGGKGTLITWFNLIQAFQKSKIEIPVNLKFIIQSLHYYNCNGFEEFLSHRRQDFFFDINYIVVCDSEWIGDKYPCIVYGSVGILHFNVTIEKTEGSTSDIREDMNKIFEKITNEKQNVLIPKFNDYVQQISPDEEQLYQRIRDFDVEEISGTLLEHQKKWDKVRLLLHFWRLPSMFVDDIKECTCEKADKSKIQRHFIIKIVPRQIVDISTDLTINHINKTCKELQIKNKVDVQVMSASRPWMEDIITPNYQAAIKATIQIYKEEPNMIREDRDMQQVTILSVISEKNVLVLPLGDKHINAGGDNENMHSKQYYEGIKLLSAYLFQVSYIED